VNAVGAVLSRMRTPIYGDIIIPLNGGARIRSTVTAVANHSIKNTDAVMPYGTTASGCCDRVSRPYGQVTMLRPRE